MSEPPVCITKDEWEAIEQAPYEPVSDRLLVTFHWQAVREIIQLREKVRLLELALEIKEAVLSGDA